MCEANQIFLFLYLARFIYHNVCMCVIFFANVANKTHVVPELCDFVMLCSCGTLVCFATQLTSRLASRSPPPPHAALSWHTCRRLADEDDELSEVQPDAVPPEVREWLASTFTRQLVTTRKRTEEKPKFRTVAHAIRAGIFVDRIYRRVSSTAMLQFPPEVVKVLKVSNMNMKQMKR